MSQNYNLIAAVDENWGIGKNGELLIHIPEDLKYFKEKTFNNIVIMGRKTFESLPDRKPLKDRLNIVLTSDSHFVKRKMKELYQEKINSLFAKRHLIGRVKVFLDLDSNEFFTDGIIFLNDLSKLEDILHKCPTKDLFVIGGEIIYRQLLPLCDTAYITKVHSVFDADAFMENLDEAKDWELAEEGEEKEFNGIKYYFQKYVKNVSLQKE